MSMGGAVTAEQIAPYLDVQPGYLERVDGQVNEDFVVSSCILSPESVKKPPASAHVDCIGKQVHTKGRRCFGGAVCEVHLCNRGQHL